MFLVTFRQADYVNVGHCCKKGELEVGLFSRNVYFQVVTTNHMLILSLLHCWCSGVCP